MIFDRATRQIPFYMKNAECLCGFTFMSYVQNAYDLYLFIYLKNRRRLLHSRKIPERKILRRIFGPRTDGNPAKLRIKK